MEISAVMNVLEMAGNCDADLWNEACTLQAHASE